GPAPWWRALEPQSDPKITEALDHSARVLDIGRSLDFVARHELVANILLSTELNGFTHEELALVAALGRRGGGKRGAWPAPAADRRHLPRRPQRDRLRAAPSVVARQGSRPALRARLRQTPGCGGGGRGGDHE